MPLSTFAASIGAKLRGPLCTHLFQSPPAFALRTTLPSVADPDGKSLRLGASCGNEVLKVVPPLKTYSAAVLDLLGHSPSP